MLGILRQFALDPYLPDSIAVWSGSIFAYLTTARSLWGFASSGPGGQPRFIANSAVDSSLSCFLGCLSCLGRSRPLWLRSWRCPGAESDPMLLSALAVSWGPYPTTRCAQRLGCCMGLSAHGSEFSLWCSLQSCLIEGLLHMQRFSDSFWDANGMVWPLSLPRPHVASECKHGGYSPLR